ncbi:MAG TPA: response regulator [Polyangiaceae bacterium]|jgi:CheY-like chemotaxis protein|nr:response regulator [Polyangiaceae bacterium]
MGQGDKKNIGRISLQQRPLSPDEPGVRPGGERQDVEELKSLSEKFGVPAIDLRQVCIRLSDLELFPLEIARKHVILPILVRDDRLFVAMANPLEKKVIDELEFVTDKKVFPYVALPAPLRDAIEKAYAAQGREEEYYLGPDCPPDVVKKAALASRPPGPLVDDDSQPVSSVPIEQPTVVLDAKMDRAQDSDFPDSGFGDLSKEQSVVTDLPENATLARAPGVKTVLVVDDELEIRTMLERLLKSKGYRVVSTDNGRAALGMVKEHAPDLILLDAMLPEVHGFDIARRIKASKRYAHIPIVMVSAVYRGWRFAEDLRESCGVEHYVEKPFKIADVLRAVEAALEAEDEPTSSKVREMSAEAERELTAGVSAYQEGRLDDAVVHLRRGIAIDPLAFRLHFHLGLLYGKKGQVYEAISELERAVEINSRHFPAVRNLAILYQKAGFRNKATEMWERALNVAPDDVTRQSIKQHLLSLL